MRFYRSSRGDGEGAAHLADLAVFDRQARAFGPDLQPTLSELRVGIVGVGGTGSSVAEQLIRLGVGELIVFDDQEFDRTNINRVYGSRLADHGRPKVELIGRLAQAVGLGTRITEVPRSIVHPSVFRRLLDCDIVFGCTDGEWSRSLLERLPLWYYIPVIDMGVKIDAAGGEVRSVQGRVTSLFPGNSCLSCRGRITAERVRAESVSWTNPSEAEGLRREGYLGGAEEVAPSVIPFTSAVAATAVTELLHRLTGMLGAERESSEVVHLFDAQRVRTNNPPGDARCVCRRAEKWGFGDRPLMMGVTWIAD